jgi:alpha-D-ribose 1-methylphosphonate 5-triphosphate synthase subunit PhnH
MSAAALLPGFADPVRQSQAVFKAVMMAMARPGTIRTLPCTVPAPGPMSPGAAAIAIALCDFETPVWLDHDLRASAQVVAFMRFQTGAPVVDAQGAAAFAYVSDARRLDGFEGFAQGTAEYPDRSTTIVIAVDGIETGSGWTLRGPGIDGVARLAVGLLPAGFPGWLDVNRSYFPCGVDIVFVAGDRIAAIPRSTSIEA